MATDTMDAGLRTRRGPVKNSILAPRRSNGPPFLRRRSATSSGVAGSNNSRPYYLIGCAHGVPGGIAKRFSHQDRAPRRISHSCAARARSRMQSSSSRRRRG